MRLLILLLAALTLNGCALLQQLATPLPHQHVIPDGNGGFRAYEIP